MNYVGSVSETTFGRLVARLASKWRACGVDEEAVDALVANMRSEGLTNEQIESRLQVTEVSGLMHDEETGELKGVQYTTWEPVHNEESIIGLPSTHPHEVQGGTHALLLNARASSDQIVGLPSTY